MKHIICNSLADAQHVSDTVDVCNNLPWVGRNNDTGEIVPNQTLKMANIVAHPDGTKWAYPVCAEVEQEDDSHGGKKPSKVSKPNGSKTEDLTDDWFPQHDKDKPVKEMNDDQHKQVAGDIIHGKLS